MSFLFGKKKQAHNPLPPATRETHTSGGTATTSSIPTANGHKSKDRGPGGAQSPPPGPPAASLSGPAVGNSVNNSINSISEARTPSPDHGPDQRGGLEQDVPVCSHISFELRHRTRSEACAASNWFVRGLLTDQISCSLLLDRSPTERLPWTVILPRCIHGPSDDLRSLHRSQTRSLDMARRSMRFHQRKGMCI